MLDQEKAPESLFSKVTAARSAAVKQSVAEVNQFIEHSERVCNLHRCLKPIEFDEYPKDLEFLERA
jgi:hypothetical protein